MTPEQNMLADRWIF